MLGHDCLFKGTVVRLHWSNYRGIWVQRNGNWVSLRIWARPKKWPWMDLGFEPNSPCQVKHKTQTYEPNTITHALTVYLEFSADSFSFFHAPLSLSLSHTHMHAHTHTHTHPHSLSLSLSYTLSQLIHFSNLSIYLIFFLCFFFSLFICF